MGTIDSIADRQRTNIEMETLPPSKTGIWERMLDTTKGGAISSVGSEKRVIRVFHDNGTHGSYVIHVDGAYEMRFERRSHSSVSITYSKDGKPFFERLLELDVGQAVRIEDASGRPIVFRRTLHPACLLDDLFKRVHA